MCYGCLKQSCVVIQNGKIALSSESCRSEVVAPKKAIDFIEKKLRAVEEMQKKNGTDKVFKKINQF